MKLLGRKHDDETPPADKTAEAHAKGTEDYDVDAATTPKTAEDRPTDLPPQRRGKGIRAALKRTFKQSSEDNLSDWAAALTYYGVLSIFPAALVLVSILGLLSSDGQATGEEKG